MTTDNVKRAGNVCPAVDPQGNALILLQSEGSTMVLSVKAALDLADAIRDVAPDAELMAKVLRKVLADAEESVKGAQ